MPDALLQIWKLVLLGFMYLFFLRVLRAIWVQLRASTDPPLPTSAPAPVPVRPSRDTIGGRGVTKLRIIEPAEQRGREFEIGGEITIGRAVGCKINIDEPYVSQLHARIYRRDDQVLIEDLGSTNGTFFNGKKATGSMLLNKGDLIQVGRTVMEALR